MARIQQDNQKVLEFFSAREAELFEEWWDQYGSDLFNKFQESKW